MPYLTPNEDTGGDFVSRPLFIPIKYVPAVTGALLKLMDVWNWEEFGDVTPQEAVDAMTLMLDGYFEGNPMIGMVMPYATATLPTNMLLCDGSSYARVDYPLLYAVLDTAFIDDADTFHTPDYVSRVARGTSGNQAITGGSDTHTLTVDEIPSHSHEIPYESCFPYGVTPEACVVGGLLKQQTGSTGGGQAHNNLPAYFGQPWGIIFR